MEHLQLIAHISHNWWWCTFFELVYFLAESMQNFGRIWSWMESQIIFPNRKFLLIKKMVVQIKNNIVCLFQRFTEEIVLFWACCVPHFDTKSERNVLQLPQKYVFALL